MYQNKASSYQSREHIIVYHIVHIGLEISCMLMLLPPPFNIWTPSITVSYMKRVRWLSLTCRRHQQTCVLIYKALLSPSYLTSRVVLRVNNKDTRSQSKLALKPPHTNSVVGKTFLGYYAPH